MRVSEQDIVLSDCIREFPCLYDKRTPEYHQRDVAGNCCKEVANKAGLENGKILFLLFQTLFFNHKTTKTIYSLVLHLVAKKKFETMRKRYNKVQSKLRSSKKSGTSTKESEEIAGEQSAIVFKRWLDPYIVNRTSKKYFEEEDYQDVQIDMKNKGDFPGQEDLQKNEKGELLQDHSNDEFSEENTIISKSTKITPMESKKRKEMSLREKEQEIKFLRDATQKFQKEKSGKDLVANLIKRKVRKVIKSAENYV